MSPEGGITRFVRRTTLGADERRVNFRQIDGEVIEALTSKEASAVSPLMSKVYLRLVNAPVGYWEREGVLRFGGAEREGKWRTGWEQMIALTEVSNSTLSKVLSYLHRIGVIGYDARKNGVGVRVFINRAASSIRRGGLQKNLSLVRTPPGRTPAPPDGTPFKENIPERILDPDQDPRAQVRRAGQSDSTKCNPATGVRTLTTAGTATPPGPPNSTVPHDLNEIVGCFRREVERAVGSACSKEAALTREWLEKAGLPKAARVAQREAYNVLRAHGLIEKNSGRGGLVGSTAPAGGVETGESREETVRLCVALATTVRGVGLDELLSEYVTRGEMTADEARSVIREAREMGLLEAGRDTGGQDSGPVNGGHVGTPPDEG